MYKLPAGELVYYSLPHEKPTKYRNNLLNCVHCTAEWH